MSQTDLVVDEAIAKIDAEEAGVTTDEKAETVAEDAGTSKPEPSNATEEDAVEEPEEGKETPEEEPEGEFTADDAEEVEVPEAQPVTPTDSAGVQLSPAEQKYLADHISDIGEPVTFTGTINGKEASYKVYDVNQLPADFQPNSVVAFQQGLSRLTAMNQKAENMLQEYRQEQSRTEAQKFEQRENEAIQADLAELQKAGEFPKFKVKPGTEGFENDPATKQMGEVLDLMNERNAKYLEDFQKGRAYRHIGFREAFELWQAKQPTKAANEAQDAEDKARKANARQISNSNTPTTPAVVKPTVKSGTTIEQILARHEND